jgi:mxaJ protein
MYSRFLKAVAFGALVLQFSCSGVDVGDGTSEDIVKNYLRPPAQEKIESSKTAFRVCADPNNLPFSNEKGQGFENRLAEMIAAEMSRPVEYTWWAQRRGFFRNTLRAGNCDVVMGVPTNFELAEATRPYYRSTYVFAWLRSKNYDIKSFDDPRLRQLKIGVQMIGDDGSNTPPVHALTNRGMVENIKGYTVYGDYSEGSPPSKILDAVLKKEIDIAVVWGPLAGYFGRKHAGQIDLRPVEPEIDLPYLPFVYDIGVGVRRGENELKAEIDTILARKRDRVNEILDEYGIPRKEEVR